MSGRGIPSHLGGSRGGLSGREPKGPPAWFDETAQLPSHTPGTPRGEELVRQYGREPGRERGVPGRTARDSTSVNAADREPIDPRMPHLPPP